MVVVGGGIDQNLLARQKLAPVPRQQRDGGGQVAAGRVADQGDLVGVGAQQRVVEKNLPRHRVAVLKPSGERVLRRQPVVHRDHGAPGFVGHHVAGLVIAVDVAGDPAAAVEKQQNLGLGQAVPGGEDAHRHLVVAAGHHVVPRLVKQLVGGRV